jgi:hypothetical protein
MAPICKRPGFYNALFPEMGSGKLERICRWLVLGVLILIFGVATWARFSIYPAPFFNPDAMGYAGPGLHHIVEGEMKQTHQRGFFYPLFLRLVMEPGTNLRLITLVQHLAGLAAGLLWWLVWSSWCARLPFGWLRRAIAPGIGLFLLLIFLWSSHTIYLEHNIRPEALFPFFAMAQILLAGWTFVLATSQPRFPKLAATSAFFAILAGCAATGLRPSWILAWLGTATMIALLFRFLGWKAPALWGIIASCICGFLFWKVSMTGAERALSWKKDPAPNDFLAKTLVSVHAPQIIDFWLQPGKWENLAPGDRDFLSRLQQGIFDSQQRKHSYQNLGFDPDYIFYRTDILRALPVPPEDHIDYLMSWYLPLVTSPPWILLPKVQKQFFMAAFPNRKNLYSDSIKPLKFYARSLDDLKHYQETRPKELMDPWNSYFENIKKLSVEAAEKEKVSPTVNGLFIQMIQFSLLPAWLVSIVCGFWFLFTKGKSTYFMFDAFIWAMFLLGAVTTVAIVHSFDIDRYQHALVFLYLLVSGSGVVLLCHLCADFFRQKFYFCNAAQKRQVQGICRHRHSGHVKSEKHVGFKKIPAVHFLQGNQAQHHMVDGCEPICWVH